MKDLLKTLEGLPWIAQLLLVLFVGIYGNLIRLLRSLIKGNVLNVILAVLAIITGGFAGILWVVDLVCVILKKPIWWLD